MGIIYTYVWVWLSTYKLYNGGNDTFVHHMNTIKHMHTHHHLYAQATPIFLHQIIIHLGDTGSPLQHKMGIHVDSILITHVCADVCVRDMYTRFQNIFWMCKELAIKIQFFKLSFPLYNVKCIIVH